MAKKGIVSYLRENEMNECGNLCVTKTKNGFAITINIDSIYESDICDAYEKLTGRGMRVCSVCGKLMDTGYMCENSDFYACSEECFAKDADERYGKGNWKPVDEMTSEDWKNAVGYFDSETHFAYLNEENKWEADYSFYTEWY